MEPHGFHAEAESELLRQVQTLVDSSLGDRIPCDSHGTEFVRCLSALQQAWPDAANNDDFTAVQHSKADGQNSQTDASSVSEVLRRFEIRRMLGHGGFGVVLLAFDATLSREVALKIPRPPFLLSADMRLRFLREAQAAAVLNHPGIVPVYDAGEWGPVCYIATGYVKGVSLAEWLSNTGIPDVRTSAKLVAYLTDAVQHAHSRGILHRDLKPSNVVLEALDETIDDTFPFSPKLTDFGLAKRLGRSEEVTLSGDLIGTPRYMAPEQAANRHQEIGIATDVYGLGAILHELLTGEPPFVGESNSEVLRQIQEQELSHVRFRVRSVPRDLETICCKCLEKEPGRRYQTARELAEDLRRFLAGEPVVARPIGRAQRLFRWCRRRPIIAGLTSALILALTAGTSTALWQWYRAELHLRESITATAHAEEQRRRAEQTILDLAWLVEESSLWSQRSSEFADAVHEKLQRYYENAALPEDRRWAPFLAAIHSFEAQHAAAKRDFPTAEARYRLALDWWNEANRDNPEKTEYRRALALCMRNFSLLVRDRSKAAGASDPLAVLRELYSNLASDKRYGARVLRDYAALMFDHGGLLANQNRKADARNSLEVGIVAAELLLDKQPADATSRFLVGKLWRCLADVQAEQRQAKEALTSLERAIESLEFLVKAEADRPEYLVELSAAYYRRAITAAGPAAHERQVDWLRKAIGLAEKVVQAASDEPSNRLRLAISLRTLAQSLRDLNRTDEAWAVSQRHAAQLERMTEHKDLIPPAEFRSLARAYHQRGLQLNAADNGRVAADHFAKGATAFERAVGFKFGVMDMLYWAECHYFLARHNESSGDKPTAIAHYERVVDLLRDLAAKRDANMAIKDRYRRSVAALAELNSSESTAKSVSLDSRVSADVETTAQ